MIKTSLTTVHGNSLSTRRFFGDVDAVDLDAHALVTIPIASVYGTFKSVTRIAAGTTTITTPDANGSLLITDILISGEKQQNSTVEVRFTDDVQNVTLFLASQVDAPAQIAHGFIGRFQGWRGARIDMITAGAADATVTLGYTKIPTGLAFAEWDALR